jgi:hypothetical protein
MEAIRSGRISLPTPDSNAKSEPTSDSYQSETVAYFATTENALGLFEDTPHVPLTAPQDLDHSQIIPTLTSLHSIQNSLDTAMDTANLRQLIRAALQTTSDVEMLEVFQIGHEAMPDAIKTLQRALEHITERDDDGAEVPPGQGVVVAKVVKKVSQKRAGGLLKRSRTIISIESSSSSTSSSGHSSEKKRDTLDREFIESGIDCLRRMSRGGVTSLPSWTITK